MTPTELGGPFTSPSSTSNLAMSGTSRYGMSNTSSSGKPIPVPNARHVAAPGAISERDDKRVEWGGELGSGKGAGTAYKAGRGCQ